MLKLFKKFIDLSGTPVIEAYRGYATTKRVTLIGRVTERSILSDEPSANTRQHFSRIFKSYIASPSPNVKVKGMVLNQAVVGVSDKAGVFNLNLDLPENVELPKEEWLTAELLLPEYENQKPFMAPVLVVPKNVGFGIVSDIDDTVLISNATRKLKLIFTTLFKTPDKRRPFPGVGELYNAFRQGHNQEYLNPIFYVSSSHWNLYHFLTHFFNLVDLPRGPLFLKSTTGLKSLIKSVGNHSHKEEAILKLLQDIPDLPLILIGDSGQKDAQIYQNIAQKYPARILAIYIRDVTSKQDPLVVGAAKALSPQIPVVTAVDSINIALHALESGYISREASQTVIAATKL